VMALTKRNRKQVFAGVHSRVFRFALWRIPDVLMLYLMVRIGVFYYEIGGTPPSKYSMVVVAIAFLGLDLSYLYIRYGRSTYVRSLVPRSWRLFWMLVYSSLVGELFLRRHLSHFSSSPRWTVKAVFWLVIVLLVLASLVAIANMLRSFATVPRLCAFLLVQALIVFVFAQPYVYGGFRGSGWDVEMLLQNAREVVDQGKDAVIRYALSADDEALFGLVNYLNGDTGTLDALNIQPSARALLDGACEQKNFGAALYLSTITWTSVGFGDLVPTKETRAVAAIESILGYLFMAGLAAVLIRWTQKPPNGTTGEEYQ